MKIQKKQKYNNFLVRNLLQNSGIINPNIIDGQIRKVKSRFITILTLFISTFLILGNYLIDNPKTSFASQAGQSLSYSNMWDSTVESRESLINILEENGDSDTAKLHLKWLELVDELRGYRFSSGELANSTTLEKNFTTVLSTYFIESESLYLETEKKLITNQSFVSLDMQLWHINQFLFNQKSFLLDFFTGKEPFYIVYVNTNSESLSKQQLYRYDEIHFDLGAISLISSGVVSFDTFSQENQICLSSNTTSAPLNPSMVDGNVFFADSSIVVNYDIYKFLEGKNIIDVVLDFAYYLSNKKIAHYENISCLRSNYLKDQID